MKTSSILVIASLLLLSPALLLDRTHAQQAEAGLTEFVPTDTYAALSLNMGAMLKKVDLDDPPLLKIRNVLSGRGELDWLEQEWSLTLFMPESDEGSRRAAANGRLTCYKVPVDPNAYVKRHRWAHFYRFDPETYAGYPIQVRKYHNSRTGELREKGSSYFFPDKQLVGRGSRPILQRMIDGKSVHADAKELVNRLDANAELHLVLDCGDRPDSQALVGHVLELLSVELILLGLLTEAKRVEVLVSYAEKIPVQLTFETNSEQDMDRLIEWINGARAAAPGALDQLEQRLDQGDIVEDKPLRPPFRALIALGRTAVQEMHIKRDGTTLHITLAQVDGLEKLPQQVLTCGLIFAAMYGGP